MKKGINHWCFPKEYSLLEAAQLAAKAGFDTFEPNVELPPAAAGRTAAASSEGQTRLPERLTAETTEAEARSLAEAIRATGLEISSLSTAALWQIPLSSPDEKQRSQGIAFVEKMLELAAWMKVEVILVVPGVVTADAPYEKVWDLSLEALQHLARVAAKHRVMIGVENVWNKFLLSPLEFRRFVEAVGSEWVGAYFDIGNVLVNGFPDQWIRILGPLVRRCHVKDFRTDIGNLQGFVPLLQGHVPWRAVVDALCEIGYDGPLTAELSPYPTAPEQLVYDTAAALDRIIGGRL